MELKSKITKILLYIFGGILLLAVLFMLAVSAFFTFGGKAPQLFGYNIYVVETDSFYNLYEGSAVIVRTVYPEDITNGEVVLYYDSDDDVNMMLASAVSLSDGIYTINGTDTLGQEIAVSQGKIIGIAHSTSYALGTIIRFAKSPLGLALIAILPCMLIIAIEIVKSVRKKSPPLVEPVKKQEEVPTYVPQATKKAVTEYKKAQSLPEDMFYKSPMKPEPPIESSQPLSSEKLSKVIAETNAEKKRREDEAKRSADKLMELGKIAGQKQKTETSELPKRIVHDEEEGVPTKEYIPKTSHTNENAPLKTDKVPHLDALFSDEDDDGYTVDEILSKLGRK